MRKLPTSGDTVRAAVFMTCGAVAVSACGGGGGPNFADDHPRIYIADNRDRLAQALEDGHPAAVRFKELVDLQLGGADLYDFQAWNAALIGQLTGDARYCEYAVGLVDERVAEEEATIAGGGAPRAAYDSYLEVGPLIGDVALTYDWCFEHVSSSQATRWLAYADQAVWNVWHHEEAQWGGQVMPWSGWSVENPSNNYYYSFLRATMLLGLAAHGEIERGDGWLTHFRDTKIGGELVPTFAEQLVGGGSREGTGYGVAMMRLWELYDLWHGSTGEVIADETEHARASLLHFMHSTVPTLDRIAPTGDHARDSTAALFDYHRHYVQTLAYLFQDDPLAARAKGFLAASSVPEMDQTYMAVWDFLYETPDVAAQPLDGLGTAFYGPGTGQLYARSSWDTDATWMNLIAGPYTESHAHRDQGAIMVYKGEWLAYDPQVESTSGIRGEEDLHNLVRITEGGENVRMREGTESTMLAVHRGDGWLHAAADTTAAYAGHEAVDSVQREVVFIHPDVIVVMDRVTTAAGTSQTWQLSSPIQPTIADTRATFAGASHTLRVDRVIPAASSFDVRSWPSLDGDITAGYRMDVVQTGGARQYLHVLSLDGAASSVTADDAGGRVGVSIAMADGRTAVVRFGTGGVDGTLSVTGGSPTIDATLGPGVDALPE